MARVRILCGPKRSGRSAAFDALVHAQWPGAFVVTPTAAYGRVVTERILLEGAHPGAWGARVATFPQFVDALLDSFGERATRIAEFERVRLAQRLLDQLTKEGALEGMGASAATPGFRNQALRAIVELKQAAVEPEDFRKAIGGQGKASPYHLLLATLYERYQEALQSSEVFDTVGLYWRAEVLAREACPPLLADTPLLALDGFDDFTPSELRLVSTLANHVDTAAFSLAFDPEDEAQGTLHGLLHGTLGRLHAAFPDAEVEPFAAPAPETSAAYAAQHVFSVEEPPPPDSLRPAVAFVPCGSSAIERDHLVRRVKRMIVEEGVPADAIAVCVPQLRHESRLLRQAFEAAGVPFRLRDDRPLAESAAARLLAGVLRAVNTWTAGDVLGVLCSPWLDAKLGPAGRAHAPLIQRKALITGGRAQWAKRLAEYGNLLQDPDKPARDARHYPALAEALDGVAARFAWLERKADALEAAASETALAAALSDLLLDLDPGAILQSLPEAQWPAETAALRTLLTALGKACQRGDDAPLAERAAWFDDLCVHTPFTRGGPGAGVLITDPEGLRHLSYRRVLFAGLNEGALPRRHAVDALFSEDDRERLRSQALALEDREHHARLERTLFHRVLEAAEEFIELSWSMADADGRERFKSPFVREVQRLLPHAPAAEPIAALFPPLGEAVTPREVFAQAFGDAPALQPVAQALDGPLFERVRLGSGIEQGRYRSQPFDAYDGALADPASLELLAARFGDEHTWSAGQFERYNQSPMLYFLQTVLRVEEPEPPLEEIDQKVRGLLVHRALERFFNDGEPLALADIGPTHAARMDTAVDAAFGEQERYPALRCVPRAILDAERARMRAELRRFLHIQSQWDRNAGWKPVAFELDFGRSDDGLPAFPLELESGVVRVTGVIDRVDQDANGAARLIDYKTGAIPAKGKLDDGTFLQLGLYALAYEQHLAPGRPCTAAYYIRPDKQKRGAGWQSALGDKDEEQELRRDAVIGRIEDAVTSVRAGCFLPIQDDKANLYGFKRAVRYEKGRIERKLEAYGL